MINVIFKTLKYFSFRNDSIEKNVNIFFCGIFFILTRKGLQIHAGLYILYIFYTCVDKRGQTLYMLVEYHTGYIYSARYLKYLPSWIPTKVHLFDISYRFVIRVIRNHG